MRCGCGLGQNSLALLNEHGCGAKIESAFRAIEEMFLELIELVCVQLIQKVPLGCVQAQGVFVVHRLYSPSVHE